MSSMNESGSEGAMPVTQLTQEDEQVEEKEQELNGSVSVEGNLMAEKTDDRGTSIDLEQKSEGKGTRQETMQGNVVLYGVNVETYLNPEDKLLADIKDEDDDEDLDDVAFFRSDLCDGNDILDSIIKYYLK